MTIREFIQQEKPATIWACNGTHFIVRRHELNNLEEVSSWLKLDPLHSLEFDMPDGQVKTARLPKSNKKSPTFNSKREIAKYLQRYGK